MKTQFIKIFLIITILCSGVLYATEIQYFYAKSDQDAILLEWKTGTESNLSRFEIERSASNTSNFISIGTITAIGSNSYYFFRDELRSENSIYFYRLKLINHDGSYTYSNTLSVTHNILSIRSTWGSIKSIFR